MPKATLLDRLQRLRDPRGWTGSANTEEGIFEPDSRVDDDGGALESDSPVDDAPALDRLERRLLGDSDGALPLKARLERLVAAASRGRLAPARTPRVPLEELVQGWKAENARGEYFRLDADVHLDSFHGDVPLSRFRAVTPGAVGLLTGLPELASFDLSRAVFLDTETTGLAGGTGTAAFLIGIGFVEADRFHVRQYFMRDYHEEPALLRGLAEDLKRFTSIVTFNGKIFDVPLLETRFRLARDRFPLAEAPHLDLLAPARRLWKLRLESCRLQSLEASVLGVRRNRDIPGQDIPQVYFDYVRSRDARHLVRVFQHNRLDIVSLAALAVLACQWVEEGRAEDPRDIYSLARVLERAQLHERSEAEYRRTAESGRGALRGRALLQLASRARKAGDREAAVSFWQQAAEAGEPLAARALAVHHEHVSHDLEEALRAVDVGLALGTVGPRGLRGDLLRRQKRLALKVLIKQGGCCAAPPLNPPLASPK